MGGKGWAWKDVLPYFKKLENIGVPSLRGDKEVHNTEGPLSIEHPSYTTKTLDIFLEAGKQMGFPVVDYNDYRAGMGFARTQSTVWKGTRMSSNRAYIRPVRCRSNLHVSKMSMVERILMDAKGKRAVGVEFTKFQRKRRVFARKEVILAAGAIGSPQLLMVSGIGPAQHLKDKGIKVIKDMPGCGKNLMDHVAYGGHMAIINAPISVRAKDLYDLTNDFIEDFVTNRTGPFTSPGVCEGLAFMDTNNITKRHGRPNMEFLFIGGPITTDQFYQLCFNVNKTFWDRAFYETFDRYGWTIFPMILKPKSRGHLELASNNIYDHPLLYPNYLDHPDDVKTGIQGIRLAIKLSQTPAWQKFGAKLVDQKVPGCESHQYDSDEYWECALRYMLLTIYHYSGTCKMGAPDDPTAVVDPSLKVIGIDGLRVCDASIMPDIVAGHPNIPVYMIAEKFSDQLKQEYGYPINLTSNPTRNECNNYL